MILNRLLLQIKYLNQTLVVNFVTITIKSLILPISATTKKLIIIIIIIIKIIIITITIIKIILMTVKHLEKYEFKWLRIQRIKIINLNLVTIWKQMGIEWILLKI